MRRFRPVFFGIASIIAFSACSDFTTTPAPPTEPSLAAASAAGAENHIILLRQNAVPADFAAGIEAAGGKLIRTMPQVGIAIAEGDANFTRAISRDSRVLSVGPEPAFGVPSVLEANTLVSPEAEATSGPTPADDLFLAGLVWGVERVNAPAAWAAGHTGSHNTVVAILDTGIASNHPDLAPNLVFNACFTTAGDHVGDWEAGAPCNPYPSLSFHGTHVAGTAAAAFGGGRVVGVAPNIALANYNVFELFPTGAVQASFGSIWAAMIDAADRGYDVINMSLGALFLLGQGRGTDALATTRAAQNRVNNYVTQAGTTIVSSAGNADLDLNGPFFAIPADSRGIMSVGATGIRPNPRYQPGTSFDVRAFYSNFGAAIDVAAPGGDCGLPDSCDPATRPADWFEFLVLSSFVSPGVACAQTQSCPVGYAWAAGTSMAAPHVAGIAGLVKDANPRLNPQQVVSIVRRTAESLGDRQQFGHGMPDAAAAAGVR
jgi:lantibiotic leader peptide-processing serine protease